MNRRERRKHAALNQRRRGGILADHDRHGRMVKAMREDSNGLGEIDVLPFADIATHRQRHEMTDSIRYWLRHSAIPKCLFCDFRFPVADEPPAYFFFARACRDGPKHWLVAGVCQNCRDRPDIAALLSEAIQPFFPGSELIDGSHQAPGRMQ
jgi:hypothetical protein